MKKQQPCTLIPSAVKGVVQFEPCYAPLTRKRALDDGSERPTFSLKRPDGRVYVYGVADCLAHGDWDHITRLNSLERYADDSYQDLLKVQLLHLFGAYRGQGGELSPTGVLSVPISVYNDEETLSALKAKVLGQYSISDAAGCTLNVKLDEKRIVILPESVGALYHYGFDHLSRQPRLDADLNGNILMVDIGYLTTDFSLHINGQYQRGRAYTQLDLGMGKLVLAIQEALQTQTGAIADPSQIDAGLRLLSGAELGPKRITYAGAYTADVSTVYDPGVIALATAIRDVILNRYKEPLALILLAGGGAYHLHHLLVAMLHSVPVDIVPDAAVANCLGAFTRMVRKASSKGVDLLLFSIDNGNGLSKGVSSETL